MNRLLGVVSAGLTALVIGLAPLPSATAAPALTGTGGVILDAVPQQTDEVRFRGGGRGFRGGRGFHGGFRGHRGFRHGFYRPYGFRRHYRPAFYGGYGYGGACFWRPARTVWTPYGWRWQPARRVCRW